MTRPTTHESEQSRQDPSRDSAWCNIVDQLPLATFVVETSATTEDDLGAILWANEAGRDLLDHTDHTDSGKPYGFLVDLVDVQSKEAIASLLRTKSAVIGQATSQPVELQAGLRTLFIKHQTSGAAIVQVVESDAAKLAEQVLEEQQLFRSALMELSELAYTTEDDDAFYQRLIERAVEVVPGAQAGSVQLTIPGTAQFRFVAAVGYDLAGLQKHVLDQSDFFRDAWDPRAQIVREFTIEARSPEIAEWLETVGRLSDIAINVSAPVLVDGFPVAFLALDNFEDPDGMTETAVEMTTVLSRLIGELWRRRDLEAKLRNEREAFRHQAMHDPLTSLPNRRSLEKALDNAARAGQQREHPRSVLFVDIDDFKGVNDRLGHEVGDLLLIAVSEGLTDVVRENDIVGRWGGDEFLVLPFRLETSAEAMALAWRVLARFHEPLRLAEGLEFRARLTIGVGWGEASSADSDLLVRCADEALYEAKKAGKGIARLRTIEPS